jgi:hypothetical protein
MLRSSLWSSNSSISKRRRRRRIKRLEEQVEVPGAMASTSSLISLLVSVHLQQ